MFSIDLRQKQKTKITDEKLIAIDVSSKIKPSDILGFEGLLQKTGDKSVQDTMFNEFNWDPNTKYELNPTTQTTGSNAIYTSKTSEFKHLENYQSVRVIIPYIHDIENDTYVVVAKGYQTKKSKLRYQPSVINNHLNKKIKRMNDLIGHINGDEKYMKDLLLDTWKRNSYSYVSRKRTAAKHR